MSLCEYVIAVAEAEAEKRFPALVSSIADEIIATAEEYEPMDFGE